MVLSLLLLCLLLDFDWSITNDFILSASLDCTARVWDPASGQCLRVVNDSHSCGVTACRFQPVNNNMLLVSFESMTLMLNTYNVRKAVSWDAHSSQHVIQPCIHKSDIKKLMLVLRSVGN